MNAITSSSALPETGYKAGTVYRVERDGSRFELISLVPTLSTSLRVLQFSVEGRGGECKQRSAVLDFRVLQELFHHLLSVETPEAEYTLYTCYHEVDDRLPGLAAGSAAWAGVAHDRTATVRKQYMTLAGIVNEGDALSEIRESVVHDGYTVRLDFEDLEVILNRAEDLSLAQKKMLPAGVSPKAVLPASIGKTFLVSRASRHEMSR